jgi:molybdate transport system ATP-binding protein
MTDRLRIDIEKQLTGFRLKVDLTVGTEILVLFGPSGAGKTQTLNALAGLLRPDRGIIRLDQRWLFRDERGEKPIDIPVRERRMAMVFQHYALFPHLTARQNIAYPIRSRREAGQRAAQLLERMRLEPLADRYPHELSGGQQQRVAIARALAADARVLLLDEPFSALDRPIREQLHCELRSLQEENGLVIVYVTHNLDDALTAGHRMAVLDAGGVVQVATLSDIFLKPRNRRVLEILGVPNLFEARRTDSGIDWDGLQLRLGREQPPASAGPVTGFIPAEEIRLIDGTVQAGEMINLVDGRVLRTQPMGLIQRVWIELSNCQMVETVVRAEKIHQPGERVRLTLPPERLILTTVGPLDPA